MNAWVDAARAVVTAGLNAGRSESEMWEHVARACAPGGIHARYAEYMARQTR